MTLRLLTEHNLVFLSLKGGCTGSSESTLVNMPHCWKSHVKAQIRIIPANIVIIQPCKILFRHLQSYTTGVLNKSHLNFLKCYLYKQYRHFLSDLTLTFVSNIISERGNHN